MTGRADQSALRARAIPTTQLLDGDALLAWLDARAATEARLPSVIYGAAAIRIRRGDFNAEVGS